MKKHYFPPFVIAILLFNSSSLPAQGTFTQVYQLIQAHCTNSGCHDGTDNTFNATVSESAFYTAIKNVTPLNQTAVSKFNKLVVPGDVYRSFLLRKMAHGITDALALDQAQEGPDEPRGSAPLENFEIELVRQWILYGAPDTGTVVDTSVINTYYRDGGINDTYFPHDAPTSPGSFRLYVGTIFLKPRTEAEYFLKYDPHLTSAIELPEFVTMLPSVTHHFVVYCFITGSDVLYRQGLRPLSESSMNDVSLGIGGGPGYQDMVLPPGTAFFYPRGQMLDIDFHFDNPSADSILATDLYVNYLPKPMGTAQHYMSVNNWVNESIVIPHDGQPHSFTATATDSAMTTYYKIWKMWSHTHKYGSGFSIWLRNPDGTKGVLLYDGNYSYEHDYDAGYYRWGSNSTIRTWPGDSLLQVDPRLGFIYEGTFTNTAGPDSVFFGPTAEDEMNVMGFASIPGDNLPVTAVSKVLDAEPVITLFPNPVYDELIVTYDLTNPGNVQIDMWDMMGKPVTSLFGENQDTKGRYTRSYNLSDYKLAAGTYFVTFNIGGKVSVKKLMITG